MKFLLYIDILGFSELVNSKNNEYILNLYSIINSLNVHSHGQFKTIVFSDTILAYNYYPAINDKNKEYCIMYLIEFAQDLQYRLTGQNVYFRAIITEGEFNHYNYTYLEAYWGKALIEAYKDEADIKCMGIFLNNKLKQYNQIFKSITLPSNPKYYFIFPTQTMDRLEEHCGASIADLSNYDYFEDIIDGDEYLIAEIKYIQSLYHFAHTHHVEVIRSKYYYTYYLYKNKYPLTCNYLELNDFKLPLTNWNIKEKTYSENVSCMANLYKNDEA